MPDLLAAFGLLNARQAGQMLLLLGAEEGSVDRRLDGWTRPSNPLAC